MDAVQYASTDVKRKALVVCRNMTGHLGREEASPITLQLAESLLRLFDDRCAGDCGGEKQEDDEEDSEAGPAPAVPPYAGPEQERGQGAVTRVVGKGQEEGGCQVSSPGLWCHLPASASLQASRDTLLACAEFLGWRKLSTLVQTHQTHRIGECLVPKSKRQKMSNSSSIAQFLLLPFTDTRELQLLHFWLFLGIYLAALLGNGLIITTIAWDQHLHTPMYFFLLNLSLLDLGSISTTVPKSMASSLWDTMAISYTGCAAQVFVLHTAAEFYLLAIMSYDCYVAICKPLHYGTLLGSRACVHMVADAWANGVLMALLHTANTFSLPLCKGNALHQFFCEIPQILKLSCSETYLRDAGLLVVGVLTIFGCFVFIVLSCVQIFRAVLRIPSEQRRHKAFSTCLPHLSVVSLFVSTGMFAYLKPCSISYALLYLVVSFLYSVVPSTLYPLIYSMRNQELKDALRKLMAGFQKQ
ncbi:olfactory receptor 14A16 [Columba livia]|uniref:olfactory receptor 14A16 n=2 Tax=Columba livia TaxID=8932 RepID=UPI0031B9B99F